MVPWLVPVVTAIVAAVGGYFLREFDKRKEREEEEYRRKEERYVNLINSLRGFIVGSYDKNLQEAFVKELNLAWLYCPDDVIKKAYALLSLGDTDRSADEKLPTDEAKEKAIGELFLALRRDLLSRKLVKETALNATDFRLY